VKLWRDCVSILMLYGAELCYNDTVNEVCTGQI